MSELWKLSASEAVPRIASRKLSAEALVRSCLERIGAREQEVGAWTHLDADAAIAQARALDAGPIRGPLHGLPIGVKDLIDTADMPTAYGSPIYAGHCPAWDAVCVAAARAAGALVLGKTVTTEFAYFFPGKTTNPHNPAHTPGGSSSGSAAAVAAQMVPLAFGTQTAGSVIRPAAYCGVVGYKPSFGLLSRAGVKSLSETLDTIGVFARCVEDAGLFVSALTGRGGLRVRAASGAPRIGICRTHEWEHAQPEARQALESAAATLSRAGAQVSEVPLPAEFASLAAGQAEVMAYEMARSFAFERAAYADRLSAKLKEIIELGLSIAPERYDDGLALGERCRMMLPEVFSQVDLLIAPSAPGEAPAGLGATGNPVFNRIWTFLHAPCLHLPFATGPNALPVGVQAIGPRGTDARTLAAASWVQDALRD